MGSRLLAARGQAVAGVVFLLCGAVGWTDSSKICCHHLPEASAIPEPSFRNRSTDSHHRELYCSEGGTGCSQREYSSQLNNTRTRSELHRPDSNFKINFGIDLGPPFLQKVHKVQEFKDSKNEMKKVFEKLVLLEKLGSVKSGVRRGREVKGLMEFRIPQWQTDDRGDADENRGIAESWGNKPKHHKIKGKKNSHRKSFRSLHRRKHKPQSNIRGKLANEVAYDYFDEPSITTNHADDVRHNDLALFSIQNNEEDLPIGVRKKTRKSKHNRPRNINSLNHGYHYTSLIDHKSHFPSQSTQFPNYDQLEVFPFPLNHQHGYAYEEQALNTSLAGQTQTHSIEPFTHDVHQTTFPKQDVSGDAPDNLYKIPTSHHQEHIPFDDPLAPPGVRVIAVHVPTYVGRGEAARLECHYDLVVFKLYSLKWYRDDMEFFRYMPSETPTKVVLPVAGIDVDLGNSTGSTVLLRAVSSASTGHYKCEVLSDAPEYYTADRSELMTVVDVPEGKPTITGAQDQYHIGETAHLTCIAPSSLPPAQITWYINNHQVKPNLLTSLPPLLDKRGLQQTRVVLEFHVEHQHFVEGRMRLRCSAHISSMSVSTVEHTADGRLSYSVPLMQARDSAYSGASSTSAPCFLLMATLFASFLQVPLTSWLASPPPTWKTKGVSGHRTASPFHKLASSLVQFMKNIHS